MCCFLLCSCDSFELPSFLDGIFPNANQDSTVEETGDDEDEKDGSPEEETGETDINGGNWTQGMPLN